MGGQGWVVKDGAGSTEVERERERERGRERGRERERDRETERQRDRERKKPSRETKSDKNFAFGVDAGILIEVKRERTR